MLIGLLQYELWFAKGSVRTAMQLQKQIAVQEQQNEELQKRNAVIEADIEDLKSGDQSIEQHARHDLGMIKKGEIFYRIVGQK